MSFIVLQFFIVGEFKKSAQIQSENNLNLLTHSVFQTVRAAMNLGDRALIDKSLRDAGEMKGIKELKIHQSQVVIKIHLGLIQKLRQTRQFCLFLKNPLKKNMDLDDGKGHRLPYFNPLSLNKIVWLVMLPLKQVMSLVLWM